RHGDDAEARSSYAARNPGAARRSDRSTSPRYTTLGPIILAGGKVRGSEEAAWSLTAPPCNKMGAPPSRRSCSCR
ncbi:MAG: hypothetical protein WBC92_16690, partial [Terracidiphilus sp.]